MEELVVATANILYTLPRARAREALDVVLDVEPDLVGLQEWYATRRRLLPRRDHVWVPALFGGTVVGARADRFSLVRSSTRFLSPWGRADRPDRLLRLEPPRTVTIGVLDDRLTGNRVAILSYHLAPGVQHQGAYRTDRPLLVSRHRAEVRRLEAIVADLQEQGVLVHAVGDSNFHGLRLRGLTSAWDGFDGLGGTLGPRRIDDVLGPGRASDVRLLTTPSDHKAVVAVRPC